MCWLCFFVVSSVAFEQLEVFRLPAHRRIDAVPAARMIEEYPFFDGARIHLAVLAKMDGGLSKPIRLPAALRPYMSASSFWANLRVKNGVKNEGKK